MKVLNKDEYPFQTLSEQDISEIYQYLSDNYFKMIKPKEPEDLEGLKITGAEIGEMVKFD
jgi:hypothetical protein